MPRRRRGVRTAIAGFVAGVFENVGAGNLDPGKLDSALNMVPIPGGKLVTRGGTQSTVEFTDGAADLDDMLFVAEYTQSGSLVIGWKTSSTKHYAFLTPSDIDTQGTRVDLTGGASWGTAATAPQAVEMFENIYIIDTKTDFGTRFPLVKVTAAGVLSTPTFDFGSADVTVRGRTMEAFNSVLFISGYDDDSEEVAILRHSFLGTDPAGAGGFDADSWAIIGSRGKPITAMKAGKDALMVAKADGLFLVTGDPLADIGWQFAIDSVEAGVSVGVGGPYGLTYYNGWWYGIGDQGPFRTNGAQITELLAARRRLSWDAFTGDIAKAWAVPHPDRGLIIFGIPGASSAYPTTAWIWDIAREEFAGDWTWGTEARHAAAIVSTSTVGPTSPPSNLASNTVTETGWSLSWTNGDAAAVTRIYLRERVGGNSIDTDYVLEDTIDAGTAVATITGKTGYRKYEVQIRHFKDGVESNNETTINVFTDMIVPDFLVAAGIDDTNLKVFLRVDNFNKQADLRFERRSVDASCANPGAYALITGGTKTIQPLGWVEFYDQTPTCNNKYEYRVRGEDTGWGGNNPTAYDESPTDPSGTCTHACNAQDFPE